MKHQNFPFPPLAGLLACLLTSSVSAGGVSPFYLGAGIGASNSDNSSEQFDNQGVCTSAGNANQTCTRDEHDNGGHIYGGFQLSESIAVEAGYVNMGNTADYHYSDPITVQQKTDGFTLTGVVKQRISQTSPISVYGKAGVVRWSSEATVKSDNPAVNSATVKQHGIDPTVGVGVEYDVNQNMSVRAGWDRYYNVGEKDTLLQFNDSTTAAEVNTLKTNVDVISAGIQYDFL